MREREREGEIQRGREGGREGGRERDGGREREREREGGREGGREAYHIGSIGGIGWSPTFDQSPHGQEEHSSHFICIITGTQKPRAQGRGHVTHTDTQETANLME
jgi:hypothetical protein